MHVPHALSTRRIDVVVCLVRAGLLLGISFLEAPTKFHAPSLPSRDVALDIGRHVFSALNRVEIVLSAFRITHLVDWSVVPTQLLLLLPAAWTDSFVDRPALIPGGVPGIQMLGNAAMVAVSGGSDSPLVRNAVTVLRPTNILATAILAMAPPVIPNVVPDLIALPLQTFVLMPLLISRAADLIRHGSSTVADGVAMDGNHEETEVPLTGFVDPLAVAERNRRVQLRRRAAVAHLAYAALEVVKVVCLVKHSWRVLVHLSLVL
ncbi:hypothetical protein BC828DRAFT_399608 [Blastocladiella britannica]|nr:hypothetical protein BC828DRAFT_399608 [Blastocladiella britannica]